MEAAAQKELHLYNDYFVDVLFHSMLPRQRVRTLPHHAPVMITVAELHDVNVAGQPRAAQRADRQEVLFRARNSVPYASSVLCEQAASY